MTSSQMRQAVMAYLNYNDIMLASYRDLDLYVFDPGWRNPDDAMWGNNTGSEYYNQNNIGGTRELLIEVGHNSEEIVLAVTPDYGEMYDATLAVQAEL